MPEQLSYYARNRERLLAYSKARYDAKKNDPKFKAEVAARNAKVDPEKKRAYKRASAERLKQNPERLAAKRARDFEYAALNPEKGRARGRKSTRKRAGIINPTGEQRIGQCSTRDCAHNGVLVLDHWHAGPKKGEVRGWLCNNCNLALGLVHDNPAILRGLAEYYELAAGVGWPLDTDASNV